MREVFEIKEAVAPLPVWWKPGDPLPKRYRIKKIVRTQNPMTISPGKGSVRKSWVSDLYVK